MAKARVKWDQRTVERKAFNLIRRNARRAGAEVREEIRNQISSPAQGGRGSAPGQPPRRRTGLLKKNIRSAVRARQNSKEVRVKVGALAKLGYYGLFLERGTVKMAKRPFIETSRTKNAMRKAMAAFLGKK